MPKWGTVLCVNSTASTALRYHLVSEDQRTTPSQQTVIPYPMGCQLNVWRKGQMNGLCSWQEKNRASSNVANDKRRRRATKQKNTEKHKKTQNKITQNTHKNKNKKWQTAQQHAVQVPVEVRLPLRVHLDERVRRCHSQESEVVSPRVGLLHGRLESREISVPPHVGQRLRLLYGEVIACQQTKKSK